MKLYANKPGASIRMVADSEFISTMSEIIKNENIQFVFESGTYLGTGSTTTLANLFADNNKIPARFITVEANLEYYKAAKKYLAKYNFVEAVFGLSVDYLEAVRFLVNDDIFNHLDKYPNVYIDHVSNAQHGYLLEIMVGVFQDRMEKNGKSSSKDFFSFNKKVPVSFTNDALSTYCNSIGRETALLILDSAAGIGFYEFLRVKQLMAERIYYIILDDVDHLKHYRSRMFIENNPEDFELINLNEESGWLIAKSLLAKPI